MSEFLHEINARRESEQQRRDWRYNLVERVLSNQPWTDDPWENASA